MALQGSVQRKLVALFPAVFQHFSNLSPPMCLLLSILGQKDYYMNDITLDLFIILKMEDGTLKVPKAAGFLSK